MAAHQAPLSLEFSLGKNTWVSCHFRLQCMKVKSESEVAQSCPTLSGLQPTRLLHPWDFPGNLDSILKSRGITLPTKVRLVKAMVFPVVMYGRESWAKKKAECQRIDAFELWSWRTPLRVPWTARRPNQSILKEISPEDWLEGLMLKAKLQYFSYLVWRTDSPDEGKDWRQEEKGATEDEMVRWHHRLDGHEFERALGVGEGQGSLGCCSLWGHKESDTTEDWTEGVRNKKGIVKLQKKRWIRKVLYTDR